MTHTDPKVSNTVSNTAVADQDQTEAEILAGADNDLDDDGAFMGMDELEEENPNDL